MPSPPPRQTSRRLAAGTTRTRRHDLADPLRPELYHHAHDLLTQLLSAGHAHGDDARDLAAAT
jgi:hypothetical protein